MKQTQKITKKEVQSVIDYFNERGDCEDIVIDTFSSRYFNKNNKLIKKSFDNILISNFRMLHSTMIARLSDLGFVIRNITNYKSIGCEIWFEKKEVSL